MRQCTAAWLSSDSSDEDSSMDTASELDNDELHWPVQGSIHVHSININNDYYYCVHVLNNSCNCMYMYACVMYCSTCTVHVHVHTCTCTYMYM